jgi:hypothetical protein
VRIKQRQQPGDRERVADAFEVAVRSDATLPWQSGKEVRNAWDRHQFTLEG